MKRRTMFLTSCPTAEEEEDVIDKISSLPDPIRSHIVSFLPTEVAIRTSVLSKQWRYLCASLPNLDFDELRSKITWNLLSRPEQFKEFVNTMLNRHDRSYIDSFRLAMDDGYAYISMEDISRWISFADEHHVCKLYLRSEYDFHPSNFNFTTLTLLSLRSTIIYLPTVFSLPLLKTLILVYVTFSTHEHEDYLFTCNCPMLDSFSLVYPMLKDYKVSYALSIMVSNATAVKRFDVHDYVGIKLKLSIPNLHEMIYRGYFPPSVPLKTLSSLHSAKINYESLHRVHFSDVTTTKILMGLHNVAYLVLGGYAVELLTWDRGLSAALPASYPGLKHLWLQISPLKNHIWVFCLLMRRFSNLQSLCIRVQEYSTRWNMHDIEVHWKTKELLERDELKLLKQVSFYGFTGSENELEIVRYILEKASILKTLNINYSMGNRVSEEIYIRTSDKIMAFIRDSPHVVLKQYHTSASTVNDLRTRETR